jgi:putative ABC transport system ATP-binding protein
MLLVSCQYSASFQLNEHVTDTAVTTATTLAIQIRDLRFNWPGQAELLRIDSLDIPAGQRVFLRGGSGSGKSTLLGLLSGVLKARNGAVQLFGQHVNTMTTSARDRLRGDGIGYIFQMFNLIPYLSVLENVLLPLRFSAIRRARCGASAAMNARQLLRALGLQEEILAAPVAELSVGQQQRVAAARALLGSPPLILADEPTSALDADHRDQFIELLLAQCTASKATLVFVSHDASLARHFDRQLDIAGLRA